MTRVLAIDDQPEMLAFVETVLENGGHPTRTTTDPRQAVALALEHGAEVIVLDVNMPQMSGFETLEVLRSEPATEALPILFLSALGESQHRIQGLRKGADDYLAKPFEREELVLRVERLGATRRRSGEAAHPTPTLLEQALRTGDFEAHPVHLGRYRVEGLIARGGMGMVLRGHDPTLKRAVALKTLRIDRFGSPPSRGREFVAQLSREAAALARFNHPNIVAVYDAGIGSEIAYIVMELVEGVSLMDLILARGLGLVQSIHVGIAISGALAAAHAHAITHQDIKPGNVLVSYEGAVKVTDFGLADTVRSLANGEQVFGTPGFIPPERLLGQHGGPAGDIFGLGSVLYLCFTGHPPFSGQTLPKLLASNLDASPTPPRQLRETIPAEISELVMEMLSGDPEARPAATEVTARLLETAPPAPAWDAAHLRACKPAVEANRTHSAIFFDTLVRQA